MAVLSATALQGAFFLCPLCSRPASGVGFAREGQGRLCTGFLNRTPEQNSWALLPDCALPAVLLFASRSSLRRGKIFLQIRD